MDKTGLNIFQFQPRITLKDSLRCVARRQHSENMFDGQPPATNNRLLSKSLFSSVIACSVLLQS